MAWDGINTGDPSGLALLYDRYAEQLYRMALQRLRNTRDAEELLHDLFLEARQKAGRSASERANLGDWLRLRIERRALDRIRVAQAAKRQAAKTGPSVDLVIGDASLVAGDSGAPEAIRQQVKDRQLGIAGSDNPQGLTRRLACLFDLESKRILELLAMAVGPAAANWLPTQLPRVQRLPFAGGTVVADADCSLLRLRPAARFAEHRHLGDEWAMVLQGSIAETGGRQFDVGDIAFSASGSRHALEVNGKTAVVLAAATFGGIAFLR